MVRNRYGQKQGGYEVSFEKTERQSRPLETQEARLTRDEPLILRIGPSCQDRTNCVALPLYDAHFSERQRRFITFTRTMHERVIAMILTQRTRKINFLVKNIDISSRCYTSLATQKKRERFLPSRSTGIHW